jgi:hypothetical protein
MGKYIIPNDIEREVRGYIEYVRSELKDRGLLEEVNNVALTMLARNYSMFIQTSKQLEIDGLTVPVIEVISHHIH